MVFTLIPAHTGTRVRSLTALALLGGLLAIGCGPSDIEEPGSEAQELVYERDVWLPGFQQTVRVRKTPSAVIARRADGSIHSYAQLVAEDRMLLRERFGALTPRVGIDVGAQPRAPERVAA